MKKSFQYFALIIISLSFFSNPSFGQGLFFQGEITYQDGTVEKGWAEHPSSPLDDGISFKKVKTSESKFIPSKDLKKIVVFNANTQLTFEYLSLEKHHKPANTVKTFKEAKWLNLVWETEKMNLYHSSPIYYIQKNSLKHQSDTLNVIETEVVFNFTNLDETGKKVYLKKKDSVNAFYIHSKKKNAFRDKKFIRNILFYIREDTYLCEQILKLQFKTEDLGKIIHLYNRDFKGN